MSRNGAGVYSLPAPPSPFVNGQTASATDMMTVLADIAAALTASIAADGQTSMTGNLNLNGNNVTGVGTLTVTGVATAANGTTGTQVVNFGQFPTTKASPGSLTFPTGLIVKWGVGTYTAGAGTVSYTGVGLSAFPTATLWVSCALNTNGGTHNSLVPGADTATFAIAGFSVYGGAGQSGGFSWLAIGH